MFQIDSMDAHPVYGNRDLLEQNWESMQTKGDIPFVLKGNEIWFLYVQMYVRLNIDNINN